MVSSPEGAAWGGVSAACADTVTAGHNNSIVRLQMIQKTLSDLIFFILFFSFVLINWNIGIEVFKRVDGSV